MRVRRLTLIAVVLACLALSSPVWAGEIQFTGDALNGQGLLSINPTQSGGNGILSIGAGNGGNGALIQQFLNTTNICAGACTITGGYLTFSTGTEASQTVDPGVFVNYTFNAGGSIKVIGGIASLGIANGSTLFSATFLPGAGITIFGQSGSFQGGLNLASIILNPLLGKYTFQTGHDNEFAFNIDAACITGGVCNGTLSQSTVQMTIPEPATLSVLGIGLFASG